MESTCLIVSTTNPQPRCSVFVIVIVNVASALCQAKNKTFLLSTQLESVATDTPQLGCRSANSSNTVYYAQLPIP